MVSGTLLCLKRGSEARVDWLVGFGQVWCVGARVMHTLCSAKGGRAAVPSCSWSVQLAWAVQSADPQGSRVFSFLDVTGLPQAQQEEAVRMYFCHGRQ